MRRTLAGLLTILSTLLVACSTEGIPKGQLSLTIQGLPPGVDANLVIEGPTTIQVKASSVLTLPAGTYTLKAQDVILEDGTRYYAEQVSNPVEVKPRQKVEASVVYRQNDNTLPATLALLIQGLPQGAEGAVRIRNNRTDQTVKTSTTLRLPPGTYLLEASPVSYGGKRYLPNPEQDSLILPPGGSVSKTITYQEEARTGELLVNITGLPSGTNAQVRVKDSAGSTVATLTASRLLSLPVGTYFVEADPVGTYTPTVSGSPANVQAGSRAEVQVVYQNRPASLSLTLEPTSLTIPRGATGTLRATLTPQNFQGQVNFSLQGAPSGISVNPSTLQVSGTTQATLTLSVGTSVAPGTYSITLIAQGQGVSASAGFSLVIPQPDFTFSLSPQSVSLPQGQTATLIASVSPQNGFSGQISFSLVNPPAGFSLSGGPVSPDGPTHVPLVLSVGTSVAPGTYSLVVKAEGGGVSRTQTLSVQVSPTTGQLALSILFQGAPTGTEGYVVLSGPNGDQVITRSQVLTLAPGTYTITAYSVTVSGVVYNPSPPGGTVQVSAGQTATFTITYAPAPS